MAQDGKIPSLTSIASIDPANDVLEIADVSANASNKVTPYGLFGITSNAASLNDSQTLTNKALTAPTIASPILSGTITGTYTLAGTPTFPSSVVTLTGSQTLTNKILTSPTLNAPTLTNASITADAISGFTTANAGTIYGITISGGKLSGTNLTNSTVGPSQLATGATAVFTTGSSTTTNTAYALLADAVTTSVTVTIGVNGIALVGLNVLIGNSTGADSSYMSFAISGATTQASNDNLACIYQAWTTNTSDSRSGVFVLTGLTAGSTTFTLQYRVVAGTGSFQYRRLAVVPL